MLPINLSQNPGTEGVVQMKQTVLVTGASRGIGLATARLFAAKGHPTVLNYNRSREAALDAARQINAAGGIAMAVQADVSQPEEVAGMFRHINEQLGGVDILINNAAVARQSLFTDIDDDEWRRAFAVNVDGVFLCSKAAIPHMLRQHGGCIINISSMWVRSTSIVSIRLPLCCRLLSKAEAASSYLPICKKHMPCRRYNSLISSPASSA